MDPIGVGPGRSFRARMFIRSVRAIAGEIAMATEFRTALTATGTVMEFAIATTAFPAILTVVKHEGIRHGSNSLLAPTLIRAF